MGRPTACPIKRCAETPVVRLSDNHNSKRRDLCERHAVTALMVYGDRVQILEAYGISEEELMRKANPYVVQEFPSPKSPDVSPED